MVDGKADARCASYSARRGPRPTLPAAVQKRSLVDRVTGAVAVTWESRRLSSKSFPRFLSKTEADPGQTAAERPRVACDAFEPRGALGLRGCRRWTMINLNTSTSGREPERPGWHGADPVQRGTDRQSNPRRRPGWANLRQDHVRKACDPSFDRGQSLNGSRVIATRGRGPCLEGRL